MAPTSVPEASCTGWQTTMIGLPVTRLATGSEIATSFVLWHCRKYSRSLTLSVPVMPATLEATARPEVPTRCRPS